MVLSAEGEIYEGVLFIEQLVTLFTGLERRLGLLPPLDFPLEVSDGVLEFRCAFADLGLECVSA
jgi:hypothetical protein